MRTPPNELLHRQARLKEGRQAPPTDYWIQFLHLYALVLLIPMQSGLVWVWSGGAGLLGSWAPGFLASSALHWSRLGSPGFYSSLPEPRTQNPDYRSAPLPTMSQPSQAVYGLAVFGGCCGEQDSRLQGHPLREYLHGETCTPYTYL